MNSQDLFLPTSVTTADAWGGRGFSLTIKELYEDCKMYRNPKIGKIFDRLPGMIDYVLRENAEQKEQDKQ